MARIALAHDPEAALNTIAKAAGVGQGTLPPSDRISRLPPLVATKTRTQPVLTFVRYLAKIVW